MSDKTYILGGSVDGHKSILAFGLMGSGDGVPVVAMLGRVRSRAVWIENRSYEGSMDQIVPSI